MTHFYGKTYFLGMKILTFMASLYKLICQLAYNWHRLVCLCLVDFDLKSISGRKSGKGFFIYSGKSSKREVSSICASYCM